MEEYVTAGTAGESRLVVYVGMTVKRRLLQLAAQRGAERGSPMPLGELVRDLLMQVTGTDPGTHRRRRHKREPKPQAA